MPRIIGTSKEEISIPISEAPQKPKTYLPQYEQLGFQFDGNSANRDAYMKFVPFLLNHGGNKNLTFSEFAIRNGFKLETGLEVTEGESIAVLQVLTLSGEILYIHSEFHNSMRFTHA